MQQKRRITRQWEALNRLRKRHAAAEARAAADNARLGDEYRHVTRAFNHLQSKFRHFKAADLARFERVRAAGRPAGAWVHRWAGRERGASLAGILMSSGMGEHKSCE